MKSVAENERKMKISVITSITSKHRATRFGRVYRATFFLLAAATMFAGGCNSGFFNPAFESLVGAPVTTSNAPGHVPIVLVNPTWVTKRISDVLVHPDIIDGLGIFRRDHMEQCWPDLDLKLREHLLRLMERFDLSYRIPDDPQGEGHSDCTACHNVHIPRARADRAACMACHEDIATHEPDAKRCTGCHTFIRGR